MDRIPEGVFFSDERIFDDSFVALSYHNDGDKIRAIDLGLTLEGKRYNLAVETFDIHAQRAAASAEEELASGLDQTYVISADEILPSDLLDIKHKNFEELQAFLVEQE